MEIRSIKCDNLEQLSDEELLEFMLNVPPHAIDKINWPEYPYKPDVRFHIAHSETSVAVMFEVKEDNVKAVSLDDNGPVWEDSCVEFFVKSPVRPGYYNFEINCIGTALGSYRESRTDDNGHFGPEIMSRIRRISSLPHEVVDIKSPGKSWHLIEIIPFDLLGCSVMPDSIEANFYKCGDKCETMHFLSWNPIDLPAPNFHCPQFFGKVNFK